MKLVYQGPHPEVVIDEFNPEQVITKGEPVELPDDLAARLLEQDTWDAADAKAEKVKAKVDQKAADSAPIVPDDDTDKKKGDS